MRLCIFGIFGILLEFNKISKINLLFKIINKAINNNKII